MEKNEFDKVADVNGFEIRRHHDLFDYYVFSPDYDGVYIASFIFYKKAEEFCNTSDIEHWNEVIQRQGFLS